MARYATCSLMMTLLLAFSNQPSGAQDASIGYDITVAIEPGSVVNDPEAYVNRIWDGIENLSKEMFRTTDSHFYIKRAQVVIPRTWTVPIDREAEHSYQTSNIRISQKVTDPRAENPNACGLPGNFIELPLEFFDSDNNNYGTPWKALLHLWARYRWGVWEEHGFAYSSRFPYSFQVPGETDWKPTGCSNVKLTGEYKNVDSAQVCGHNGEYPPGPDCRFFPDASNTATSSLMHYHSIESITDFCNADTHDKESPNKQNTFCQQLSVWETIQQSPEFVSVGDKLEDWPPLEKVLVKPIARPILYLLLDNGLTMAQQDSIVDIKGNLTEYFNVQVPKGVMASIGLFPPTVAQYSTIEELVPLMHINEDNLPLFELAIQNYNPSVTNPSRNFGRALEETITKVKNLRLEAGAVIFVLKNGDGTMPGQLPYEETLVAILKESNIKVYAIELQTSKLKPNINFKNLVTQAEGDLIVIDNPNSLRQLTRIFNQVLSELKRPMSKFVNRYLFKGHVTGSPPTPIPILHAGLSQIYLTLTLDLVVDPSTVKVTYDLYALELTPRAEWDKTNDLNRRVVYGGYFEVEDFMKDVIQLSVEFTCPVANPACTGVLVVSGEILMQSEVDDLTVTVSTSEYDGVLNLRSTQLGPSTTPFAIFASIRDTSLRPVMNIESVTASLQKVGELTVTEIELKDDGHGTPDTFVGDGIYSSAWIPPVQNEAHEVYRIWVTVFHSPTGDPEKTKSGKKSIQRLMPEDQKFFCENGQCDGVLPSEYYSRSFSTSDLVVLKSDALAAKPAQILDFKAWAIDDYKIRLTWTAPIIFNDPTGQQSAEFYELRIGDTLEEVSDATGAGVVLPQTPGVPGTPEIYEYAGAAAGEIKYFAIVAIYDTIESRLSRIVGVITRDAELIITTQLPPQPTTEPWTSTVTTPEPTPGPTMVTSHESTTTEMSSEEPVEYWFEKPEGYITLSVFGAGIVVLILGVIIYKWFSNRNMKRQGVERLP